MPSDVEIELHMNRYPSRGIVGRLKDALAARRRRAPISHVLGDVHYLAWFLPRANTVLTVLDCVSLERFSGAKRWIFWFLWYWWPLKRVAQVTVISEFSRDSLLSWVRYPPEQIHVIHPPLSLEFEPAPRTRNTERPRLLQIGTGPNKNLPRVIEAIAGLPVQLSIVGTPDEAVRDRMKELEIEFETHAELSREDLVAQYEKADMIVFASTYEGFGLPIIEAQAVGRPVVAGNVCAMPEAAGDAACMVDPFDVADIRRGIRRLIDDQDYADMLVEKGFENARRFAPSRIAEEYAEVYRLVAGR